MAGHTGHEPVKLPFPGDGQSLCPLACKRCHIVNMAVPFITKQERMSGFDVSFANFVETMLQAKTAWGVLE